MIWVIVFILVFVACLLMAKFGKDKRDCSAEKPVVWESDITKKQLQDVLSKNRKNAVGYEVMATVGTIPSGVYDLENANSSGQKNSRCNKQKENVVDPTDSNRDLKPKSSDYIDKHPLEDDLTDPGHPLGFTNPMSPNYIFRQNDLSGPMDPLGDFNPSSPNYLFKDM